MNKKDDPLKSDKTIEEMLGLGLLEESYHPKGNRYKLSGEGWDHAKNLIQSDPQARAYLFTLCWNQYVDSLKETLGKDYGYMDAAIHLLKLEGKLKDDGIPLLAYLEQLRKEVK